MPGCSTRRISTHSHDKPPEAVLRAQRRRVAPAACSAFVAKVAAVAMLGDEQQLPHRLPGLERRVCLRRLA